MSQIQPLKSLRQQHLEGRIGRKKGIQKLELANQVMQKAVERNMDRSLMCKAIDLYSALIDESPELSQPYLALAYLSWKIGEPEQAQRILKGYLAIEPHSKATRRLLEEISESAS